MTRRIGDYALLSNCRANALVSKDGSIDWLCLPEPQSPALFWKLLDTDKGGFWRLSPRDMAWDSRQYLSDSMTIESTFCGPDGSARLTDLLQVSPGHGGPAGMAPDHELTRRIECTSGVCDVEMRLRLAPNFGRTRPRLRFKPGWGVHVEAGPFSFLLATDLPLRECDDGTCLVARERLEKGDVRWAALGETSEGPQVWPMIGAAAHARSDTTGAWWRAWAAECHLPSVAPEMVLRSALTLKSMVYAPTGAVLAAPTTSLPEEIGGERNWDYRFCWVRDASFTMRALLNLGKVEEAAGFFRWLLYATRLTWPKLSVLYDVHGRRSRPEHELDFVAGYEGSRPVRVGNAAKDQRQLDTYGALLDAAWQFHERGGQLSRAGGRMLRGFAQTARDSWRLPDDGIWEVRSGRSHHTLSKAMCWVAMDRALRLARAGVMDIDEDRMQQEMDEAKAVIRREGYNRDIGSYTGQFGNRSLDASLLLLSVYGFEDPCSPEMNSTIDRIYEQLGEKSALFRYRDLDDGLTGKEGRFGICGFWGVEALAAAGRVDEAETEFEALMARATDVGLFGEEEDIENERVLGNFPQALTHVGVINAATTLSNVRASGGACEPAGEATTS